jgi:sugar O-acyltransferase (sialic acid O-acetyltransferase NeuD family)
VRPSKAEKVVLYGASGMAVAIRDMIVHGLGPCAFEVVAYIDDFRGDQGLNIDGAPIILFSTWRVHFAHLAVLVSVGNPAARRGLAGRIAEAGGRFATAYHPVGSISPSIDVGAGTIIAGQVYAGPYVTLGQHVFIMPMVVIGHDVTIGHCVTVSSSASIAGHVVIEDDVFIGAGAVIVNGTVDRPIRIGSRAHIAAGAVVTRSLAAELKVAGNPARELRKIAAERRSLRRLE